MGKGGGTVAALAAAIVWLLMPCNILLQLFVTVSTIIIGIWSGNVVEAEWGKDSSKVVIDEVGGMFVSVLLVPVSVYTILAGLILFRFFDIVKPLGIRRMERFKGGWGVMLDDLLAGVYANVVLQLVIYFNLIPYRP